MNTKKGKIDEWLTEHGLLRIESYARDGLTDQQIMQNMGIGKTAFYRWQNEHEEIREALKKGKAPVDAQVENALLKRALGYDVEEEVKEIQDQNGKKVTHIRKVKKHIPADVTAQIYWLKNRKPERWRDKIIYADTSAIEKLDKLLEETQANAEIQSETE